jgi:excisionase family DNA binding protein
MIKLYIIRKQLDRIERKLDSPIRDKWLTTFEVAQYTDLSISTIHRAINRGDLKVHQGTGKNRFRREHVDRWIKGG